ncbi:hypothetical protein PanWU01x14_178780 [Parasponia andersonii]|uniref:Uncharacterized protein n=1 Tax=Parasponia andersonii TaxID=3476 RepID=A0A2P5C6F5_PARAD|nr:hypothetical protein PanWU01x14_178780 [Parasponia andersonii]
MSHRTPLEVVALDTTLEALPNGGPGHIHQIPFLEHLLQLQPLVGLETLHGLEAELLEMAHGDGPGLFQVAQLGLGELAVPDAAVAHLDGVVSVGGLGLHLGDDVAFLEADDGDGDDLAVVLEEGHHAEFGGHESDAGLHAHHAEFGMTTTMERRRRGQGDEGRTESVRCAIGWVTSVVPGNNKTLLIPNPNPYPYLYPY